MYGPVTNAFAQQAPEAWETPLGLYCADAMQSATSYAAVAHPSPSSSRSSSTSTCGGDDDRDGDPPDGDGCERDDAGTPDGRDGSGGARRARR
eukprot:2530421-Pleurochrysis_carterae.AAC.1